MGIFDASSLPSGPTSKSTSTSSIQPWAQPYVDQYLQGAQSLANQGPIASQQQVYNTAQNLQAPGQFAQGTDFLNQSGAGLLGTTGTALGYGAQGAGYGQQATMAGQNYANMATDPSSIQAYMNPYIQQSLAPQLQMLNQQQALAGQGISAKAVGQGAFGGNRATLAQGLNAQNFDLARQQAIGQGYNEAFKNAQQAQQYGSSLGLQGLATGIQGANTGLQGVQGAQQGYQGATQAGSALGNIGAQQNQAGLASLALQNQIANQQYNLPYQNLQFQQSMLNGLPISSTTQQGYQAPPNALSQSAGIGATLLGGAGLLNKSGLLDGAGNAIKNWWSSPSGSNNYIPNQNPAMDNRDVGNGENPDPNYVPEVASTEYIATGGQIRERRYASGGLVSLALAKALKG